MWTDATDAMCGLRMYLMTIGLSIMLAYVLSKNNDLTLQRSLILKEIKIYLLFAAAARMKNLQLKGRYMLVGTTSAMIVAIVSQTLLMHKLTYKGHLDNLVKRQPCCKNRENRYETRNSRLHLLI